MAADCETVLELGEIRALDFQRYAQATADLNPVHFDDEVARSAGHPGIVAVRMVPAEGRMTHYWRGIRADASEDRRCTVVSYRSRPKATTTRASRALPVAARDRLEQPAQRLAGPTVDARPLPLAGPATFSTPTRYSASQAANCCRASPPQSGAWSSCSTRWGFDRRTANWIEFERRHIIRLESI